METSQIVPPLVSLRERVEDFLYAEAALLDSWNLDEWIALFTEDAAYVVPSMDVQGAPTETLALISDDMARLRGRVRRLKSRRAHREFPWSRTRRLVTNVRVTQLGDGQLDVRANFVVYRVRRDVVAYLGEYTYTLVETDGTFKIRYRHAALDLEELSPHGSVSIIL